MNKIVVIIALLSYGFIAKAQTTLNRGDLAIVGVNSTISPSSQDEISFVCFKDITNGTSIQVTDNGYEACTAGQWSSAEGGATLTRTGGTIAAGTVMTFRDSYNSGNPIRFTYPDANWSTADLIPDTVRASYLDLNSLGDQIYFAQNGTWTMQPNSSCTVSSSGGWGSSTTENGTFPGIDGRILFGFSTSGSWLPFQFSTGESGLYPDMGCFTMALAGSAKYNKYTGLLTNATQTEWLSRISSQTNWSTYGTSAAYFNAKPDFHSLKLSINPSGLIPTPAWSSPKNLYCTMSGTLDLTKLVTGTTGGTWSGTGVSSNGIFDPKGLNGTYDITYSVNYNSANGTCALSKTDTINVGEGVTPTFNQIASVEQGSVAPILPTSSTNTPTITGTWNEPVNTATKGITTYTFTPTIGLCNGIATMGIDVIDSSLSPLSSCLGSTLLLSGISGARKIAWYKDGKLDTTINQTRAPNPVTVAGGKVAGAGNSQLSWPWGVAADYNRNVYVSDYNNDRVMLWPKGADTGKVIAGVTGNIGKVGTTGQIPGYFNNPTGLFLSSTGSLYIADLNHHKVQKYINTTSGNPTLVTDVIAGNKASDSTSSYEGLANLANPRGIFVDKDSNLFVADAGDFPRPYIFSTSTLGNRIMEWPPASTTGQVMAGTNFQQGNSPYQLSFPTGVYVNKNGDIYVADFANFRIMKWAKGASFGTIVADLSKAGKGGVGVNPIDVWVDEYTDTLYITASNDIVDFNVLPVFSQTDNMLLKWGENAATGTILSTDLLTPSSLTIATDGSIYVADRGNNRVQAWLTSIDTTLTPTLPGSYFAIITAFDGTIDNTNIIQVGSVSSSVTNKTICQGNSYNFNGTSYSKSGIYTTHLTNSGGCDSAATLVLAVIQPNKVTINQSACNSFNWHGNTYNTSGNYTFDSLNVAGCDSLTTLSLTITHPTKATITQTACNSFNWHGNTYNANGDYTFDSLNVAGCDSLTTLALTITHPTKATITQTACNSFNWHGNTYNANGNYTFDSLNAAGCDSLTTLSLTIIQKTNATITQTACNSFNWHGNTYKISGNYTFDSLNAAGCDSLTTLSLTITQPTKATITQTACNSFNWHGNTYNSSGNYTFDSLNAAGCDSLTTLALTITNQTKATITQTACNSFNWHDNIYKTSGNYTFDSLSAAGCDSLTTLSLTITQPTKAIITQTACNSFNWHGNTYNSSGNYTFDSLNAAGCDSLTTLALTITNQTKATITQTACNSFNWHDNIYKTSGNSTFDSLNAAGCDSLTTLSLTITQPTKAIITQTACNSFNWHGNIYKTSGNYTFDSLNAAGCDSLTTLSLTITQPTKAIITQTACNSFNWHGNIYKTSGNYTFDSLNAAVCDSLTTLSLTITHPTKAITPQTACNSFNWHGNTYNTSGNYTFDSLNAAGCDSLTTLVLTILNPSPSITKDTICEGGSFTFNGLNYTKAGTYNTHLTTKAGCDSIATLVLTIDSTHIPYPITGKNQVCKGDTIILTDLTPGGSWSSLTPSTASVDDVTGIVKGLDIGTATIQYTAPLICGTASITKSLPVLGVKPKVIPIPKDVTCINPSSGAIKLSIIGNEEPYYIGFNGSVYDTTYTIPNLQVGTYGIVIYNTAMCPVDNVNVQIGLDLDQSCDTLYVPTAFVPTSNEPNNRFLKPYGGGSTIQNITFKVFNRYGNIVFETHNLNSGWDGTVNGTLQDIGTYIWYLDYTQGNSKIKHSRGTSVLIR